MVQRTEVSLFLFQTINYGCYFFKGKINIKFVVVVRDEFVIIYTLESFSG